MARSAELEKTRFTISERGLWSCSDARGFFHNTNISLVLKPACSTVSIVSIVTGASHRTSSSSTPSAASVEDFLSLLSLPSNLKLMLEFRGLVYLEV